MPNEPTPPPELRARVLGLAAQSRPATRSALRRRVWTWLALGLAVPVVVFALLGGVERGPRPSLLVAVTASSALTIALVALAAALGRAGRSLGPSRARLWAIAIALPLLLTVIKLGASAAFPNMSVDWVTRPGLRCFGMSLLLGLSPVAAFLVARRRSDPVHPRALGAALGAAGGFWAATLVDLWCPVGHPLHVVLGHVLPTLILACLGAWAGSRLLGIRGDVDQR